MFLRQNTKRPMLSRRSIVWTMAFSFLSCGQAAAAEPAKHDSSRWLPQIRAFEAQDKKQSPPKHGIVFVGSSSIRLWDLDKSFGKLPTINRGFGGSQMADSIHFAQQLVVRHQPKIVVLYAGDNDIAAGKSPEQVAADYQTFVALIHKSLPKTRIVFIPIKPSIQRWGLIGKMRQANRLIAQQIQRDERLVYVDIDTPMIGADRRPRKELFAKDGLHLNDKGYELWTTLLRPYLSLTARR